MKTRMITALALAVVTLGVGACGDRKAVSAVSASGAGADAAATGAGAQGAAGAPREDLFAFAAGTRIVSKPEDIDYASMAYGPYNLLDEEPGSEFRTAAGGAPTLVLELPERAAIASLSFDTGGLTNDEKSAKSVKVEVSDTSATTGYQTVLIAELKQATNDQAFTLPAKATGRWVRLTLTSNYGAENVAFTGFHGYGEQVTHDAKIDSVSGTYEGASGWGMVRLKQEGSRVVGCYDYREGLFAGGVEGRMLKGKMVEKEYGGGTAETMALFAFSADQKTLYGFTRAPDSNAVGFDGYWSAVKVSDDIGDCPIPGWKGADAAKSQLGGELEREGRARLDGVNFDFNSAVIQAASKPLLDQVAQMLKDHPVWQVTLEGHTDNVGGQAFNQTLSTARAQSVLTYLVGAGVPAGRLEAAGFGFSKPVASNDTQAGRTQNRRVEIVKR